MKNFQFPAILFILMASVSLNAQDHKFKQLKQKFATANTYRTASGAPGHEYWQQQANYQIEVTLDDNEQKISGDEVITYINNSPDPLNYLWIQLDQNVRAPNSLTDQISTGRLMRQGYPGMFAYGNYQQTNRLNTSQLTTLQKQFEGGFNLEYLTDMKGHDLSFTVNYTMMRLDLPEILKPGEKVSFKIGWWYNINDRMKDGGGRSGMEYFPQDDNYIYTIAQFYPRMAVYNEVEGWQNKQFLGRGEFTLPFGDFDVKITVPADHVLGATGVLQNSKDVLSERQLDLFEQAKTASDPVLIVTEDEAIEAEKNRVESTKTWHFKAKNVRDFAFASSRKFIWDAVGVPFGDRTVMAMSYYPKEGNPLWEKYSTRVVAHTVKTYSKYTFDYPYPIAISVHTDRIGMEYPMICFNGGRPNPDGTYSEGTKFSMLGVIIHEVGHNFFPMIVNSDERQWTWMDEGLNTFLQGLAEREWDEDWTNFAGNPREIVYYMRGDQETMVPIMTNSESILQFNSNAYRKPAVALNILRETVMGPELFDFAFKQYALRWMFKHPTPEDFFRTMEDASAVDLDWFWRGWFYGTDHVDISIDEVRHYVAMPLDPDQASKVRQSEQEESYYYFKRINEEGFVAKTQQDERLKDQYNDLDPFAMSDRARQSAQDLIASLTEEERAVIDKDYHYYEIDFTNEGGLVMPILLNMTFADGTSTLKRIPVEIWRQNTSEVTKLFISEKEVVQFELDPFQETADTDRDNNFMPKQLNPTRFQLYKSSQGRRY